MTATPHPDAMDEASKAGFSTMQAEHLVKLVNSLHSFRARCLIVAFSISILFIFIGLIVILAATHSNGSRIDTGFASVSRQIDTGSTSVSRRLGTATVQATADYAVVSRRINDLNTRIDETNTRIGDTVVQLQALIRANSEHLARIEKLLKERLPPAQ